MFHSTLLLSFLVSVVFTDTMSFLCLLYLLTQCHLNQRFTYMTLCMTCISALKPRMLISFHNFLETMTCMDGTRILDTTKILPTEDDTELTQTLSDKNILAHGDETEASGNDRDPNNGEKERDNDDESEFLGNGDEIECETSNQRYDKHAMSHIRRCCLLVQLKKASNLIHQKKKNARFFTHTVKNASLSSNSFFYFLLIPFSSSTVDSEPTCTVSRCATPTLLDAGLSATTLAALHGGSTCTSKYQARRS